MLTLLVELVLQDFILPCTHASVKAFGPMRSTKRSGVPTDFDIFRLPTILANRARAPNLETIAELVPKIRERLVARATRWHLSLDDAEDAFEDVIVSVIHNRAHLQDASLAAYIARAIDYRAIDYLRRQRKNAAASCLSNTPDPALSSPVDLKPETRPSIFGAVRKLPPRPREVVLLRYREGLSYLAIATRLGISARTVEAHLRRAHSILRQSMADHRFSDD